MQIPGEHIFSEQAADLLSAMANAKRLEIIGHLLDAELPVNQIADRVNLSQSALSQHLAKLRALELVDTRRDKQSIFYSCNSEQVRLIYQTLDEIFSQIQD